MKHMFFPLCLVLCTALVACGDDDGRDINVKNTDTDDSGGAEDEKNTDTDDAGGAVNESNDTDDRDVKVGFEILQILSLNEIIVWINTDMTREQFDTIQLPQGWFKNEPREGEPDSGAFARSPDASADGEFTDQEHFGHIWRHNATVIEANTPLDDQGLLRLNRISKFHTVTFFAKRSLKVLVSPEGDQYVRISRDADRIIDEPTLPSDWTLLDYVTPEELTIQLPNPTINIRTDNEDSFQGPIPQLTSTRGQKLGVFHSVVRVPLGGNTECRYGQQTYS